MNEGPVDPLVSALLAFNRDRKERAFQALCKRIGVEYQPIDALKRIEMIFEIGIVLSLQQPEFNSTATVVKKRRGRPLTEERRDVRLARVVDEMKQTALERHGKVLTDVAAATWLHDKGYEKKDPIETLAPQISKGRKRARLLARKSS